MENSKVDKCIEEQSQLESARANWDNQWREVAERVRPEGNNFNIERAPGDKRNQRIFDSTAPLALPKFMAACSSMVAPSTQRYQTLMVSDETLNKRSDVREYLEAANDLIFRVRYAPMANFQAQSAEMIMDFGAFGTGVLFTDDLIGQGVRYKSIALAESYIAEDQYGVIDTLHRKFKWTAKQAVAMFGREKLSPAVTGAFDRGSQERFWFLHVVKPNYDYDPQRKDFRGMKFCSYYMEVATRNLLDEGGYRVFPYSVPRYETASNEVYGRGPAMKVLPDIKMLNEMMKTTLRAAQLVVSPPLMLSDDASLQAFNVTPNALNFGGVDNQGRRLVMPLETGGKVELGLEMMNQVREVINDAFFVTLFRILVDEPTITATEAMLRAQEKGQLLGPPMGRLQSEWLGPQTERELDILSAAGALPPMPDALKEAGSEVHISYQSPLNLAQRSVQGVGILTTLEQVSPIAQIDPSIMKIFKGQDIARELSEINGMPAKLLNSEEEMKAINDQDAQAAQAQQLLAAAPQAASAAKDLAQAGSMVGQQQAPAILPQGA